MSEAEVSVQAPNYRRTVGIEIAVVLTLFYLPALVYGTYAYLLIGPHNGLRAYTSISSFWISSLQKAVLIPAILFIAWGSGDSLQRFGLWRGRKGAGVWAVPFFFIALVIEYLGSTMMRMSSDSSAPRLNQVSDFSNQATIPPTLIIAILVHVIIAAFLEEFVMRGYLIPRLTDLWNRPWLSLAVSTTAFASFHIYQGVGPMLVIFFVGVAYTALLKITRSVWPGTMAHAAMNFFIFCGYYSMYPMRR